MRWDADQQRLKLAKGSDTWEMMYDPVAGIPAVLLARNYVSSTTSYDYYVRMPGGELLASFTDGETPTPRYYHSDYLGSTVLMSTGTGGISASNTYDAWGDVLASSGSGVKPYEYVGALGYYAHSSQGTALGDLLQLGVRFYDPETGRFTQRDPISYESHLNAYEYAAGGPVGNVDPQGLAPSGVQQVRVPMAPPARPPRPYNPCDCGPGFSCSHCHQNLARECMGDCKRKYAKKPGAIAECVKNCRAGVYNCDVLACQPPASPNATQFRICVRQVWFALGLGRPDNFK